MTTTAGTLVLAVIYVLAVVFASVSGYAVGWLVGSFFVAVRCPMLLVLLPVVVIRRKEHGLAY